MLAEFFPFALSVTNSQDTKDNNDSPERPAPSDTFRELYRGLFGPEGERGRLTLEEFADLACHLAQSKDISHVSDAILLDLRIMIEPLFTLVASKELIHRRASISPNLLSVGVSQPKHTQTGDYVAVVIGCPMALIWRSVDQNKCTHHSSPNSTPSTSAAGTRGAETEAKQDTEDLRPLDKLATYVVVGKASVLGFRNGEATALLAAEPTYLHYGPVRGSSTMSLSERLQSVRRRRPILLEPGN
jgi:hypothetical protein